jgi:hypothetical protein
VNEEDSNKLIPLRKQLIQLMYSVEDLQESNSHLKFLEHVLDALDQAYYISVFGKLPERGNHG